jgi:hypothetical protein
MRCYHVRITLRRGWPLLPYTTAWESIRAATSFVWMVAGHVVRVPGAIAWCGPSCVRTEQEAGVIAAR